MIYTFECKACHTHEEIDLPIDGRNTPQFCMCEQQMVRVISVPQMTVQTGCLLASQRDGVGCLIAEDGKVYPPKSRGTKESRIANVRK